MRYRLLGIPAGIAGLLVIMGQGAMTIRSDGLRFPDGSLQTSAAATDTRRAYYLTATGAQGNQALGACAPGFHMASIWEIRETTALRYATEVGDAEINGDSGQGPPGSEAGWVRTGYDFANVGTTAGTANCSLWTSNSGSHHGTIVALPTNWAASPFGLLGPWIPTALQCNVFSPVWCVEDAGP